MFTATGVSTADYPSVCQVSNLPYLTDETIGIIIVNILFHVSFVNS